MKRSMRIWCIAMALLACGCADNKLKQFSQLSADDTGIDFVNENHETERSNILTYEYFYNGGGVALGDINNDGLLDVYLSSTIYENKLYLNKGNLEFEDITASSGTACEVGWKTGVSMVDVNADGYLDIYVCRSASPDPERRRNILLINNKDGTFTNRAKEYGLDDDSYTTQAAFFDFDRDNDLDVFLLNHSILEISNSFLINLRNSKNRFPHVGNKLLENKGGKFIDVSDSLGVYGPASNYGLGLSISDINNDGWPDLYTGCDYTGRDKLLFNQSGKFFLDATDTLSHISKFTMGTDVADVNNDGLLDIFTVDMLPEGNTRQKQLFGSDRYDVFNNMVLNGLHKQYMRNMLHLNNGDGTFTEAGQIAGVSATDWSWGALIADFDNDAIQDIFITNGFKRDLTDNDFAKFRAAEDIRAAQRQGKKASFLEVINQLNENKIPNYAFKGEGNLSFKDVSADWGFADPFLTNGVAYGDLDNDGDLDIVTNNINDRAGVYRNNADILNKNGYVRIKLSGNTGNAQGIGARVTVFAGGKRFLRENFNVRGFQSSVDPALHVGIGTATRIDSVHVRWPDGQFQTLNNIGINQTLNVQYKNAGVSPKIPESETVFARSEQMGFQHLENDYIDFRVQALLPRMYSAEGPALAVADVDGHGQADTFFGGALGQRSELWLGARNGELRQSSANFNDQRQEVVDAVFFDADNDHDNDLYVVTGGYEFSKDDELLADKLFLNDGKGGFSEQPLPRIFSSGSCVRVADVDRDGDQDLFVGGRVVPGRYPETPQSQLLLNDGKGAFSLDASHRPLFDSLGMVTDAKWVDINNDRYPDLVVVGEWMAIKIFINEKGRLTDRTSKFIAEPSEGFWNSLLVEDFDLDGDLDLIAGNQGLNTQMRASTDRPVTLVYDDFDNNGSVDPILNYYIQDKSFPYPTRDELTEQLPSFKKRFTNYKSYSNATINEVLTEAERAKASQLNAYSVETWYLRNDNGKFLRAPLPREIQIAPVTAMLAFDIDGDGNKDLLTGGNLSRTRARTGEMTGNFGFVFKNDGKGNFTFLPPRSSGISVKGDVKKIIAVGDRVFYAINNKPVASFYLNKNKPTKLTLVSK